MSTSSSIKRFSQTIAHRGKGSWIWDINKKKYLDFTSGIGAASTGHCHPHVVKALRTQSNILIQGQQNIFSENTPLRKLVGKMDKITPPNLDCFFFTNSGSEAVENAIKIARSVTGRQKVVSFTGGFHGRTLGALSATHSNVIYKQGLGPLVSGFSSIPFPVNYYEFLRDIDILFTELIDPDDIAAFVVEPIQGEGGINVLPSDVFQLLSDISDILPRLKYAFTYM